MSLSKCQVCKTFQDHPLLLGQGKYKFTSLSEEDVVNALTGHDGMVYEAPEEEVNRVSLDSEEITFADQSKPSKNTNIDQAGSGYQYSAIKSQYLCP